MPDEEPELPDIHGYGVRFFRYAPDMNERIQDWADQRGVRILSVVPVYFEEPHAQAEERTE